MLSGRAAVGEARARADVDQAHFFAVTSVPSDSPDDWAALRDMQRKPVFGLSLFLFRFAGALALLRAHKALREKFGIKDEMVRDEAIRCWMCVCDVCVSLTRVPGCAVCARANHSHDRVWRALGACGVRSSQRCSFSWRQCRSSRSRVLR